MFSEKNIFYVYVLKKIIFNEMFEIIKPLSECNSLEYIAHTMTLKFI